MQSLTLAILAPHAAGLVHIALSSAAERLTTFTQPLRCWMPDGSSHYRVTRAARHIPTFAYSSSDTSSLRRS
jgi:hypothetical protein